MKKILSTIAILTLAALSLGAKPKTFDLTIDFSTGVCPLVTTKAGEQPEKPSIFRPRTGVNIPKKIYKTSEDAVAAGYTDATSEKGVGFYFAPALYNFECNGKTYSFSCGTNRNAGKMANLCFSKSKSGKTCLLSNKMIFAVPVMEGMKLKTVKIYTVRNSKKVNEKWNFKFYSGKWSNVIAATNGPEASADSVLEADFSDAEITPETRIGAYTNNAFYIEKIVFSYVKEKAKKAKK